MSAAHLLTIAAATRAALVADIERLRAGADDALVEACRQRRVHVGAERLALVGTVERLRAGLDLAATRLPSLTAPRWMSRPHGLTFRSGHMPGRVAFLFPGQGSEHLGMLRCLRNHASAVQRWFDAVQEAAARLALPDPMLTIEPPDEVAARAAERALQRMEVGAQLGSVAALAMHDVAIDLGLRADLHVGHSNGEHPAVIAAGRVMQDPVELCAGFLRLGQAGARLPPPPRPERLVTMAAMPRAEIESRAATAAGVFLAMHNCPSQSVVGGDAAAVDAFAREAVTKNAIVAPLPFERAYHTPLFEDWSATLLAYYDGLPMETGRVPVFSCHAVATLPEDAAACRRAMAAQWTGLVRFTETIEALYAAGVRSFVELGPAATLTAFVGDILRGRPHVAASLDAGLDDGQPLQAAAAELFVAGHDLDAGCIERLIRPAPAPLVLPAITAVEEARIAASVHRRLIAAARQQLARVAARSMALPPIIDGPLLGTVVERTPLALHARQRLMRTQHPFVDHHALGRPSAARDGGAPLPVIAFTMSLEIAAEAARALVGDVWAITGVRASRWLALDDGALDLDAEVSRGDTLTVRLFDRRSAAPGAAFEATVANDAAPAPVIEPVPCRAPEAWSAARFYGEYAFHGPAFQGLREVTAVGDAYIAATLEVLPLPGCDVASCVIDPALLDCAGQLVAFWMLEVLRREPAFGVFPFRLGRLRVDRGPLPAGTRVRAEARVVERHGLTNADVVFTTEDGAPIMSAEGLEQRIMWFPPLSRRRLIDGDPSAVPGFDEIDFLSSSFFIWERTLAHLALSDERRREWAALGPSERRVRWLLETLAGDITRVP